MVDLIDCVGYLDEAKYFINNMPIKPNVVL